MAVKKREKTSYDDKLSQYFLTEEIEPYHNVPTTSVWEQAAKSKEELENEDYAQDIKLKKSTLWILFGFLTVETLVIFGFSFFQAVNLFGFRLEDWSFRLLVTATISQITFMLHIAVKHLFPGHRNK
jgi:hypothetical protein